jgi:hypothetical protein
MTQNSTTLRWSVSVAGYAYEADDSIYYLALLVLFSHTLIALCHMAWTFWTGSSSDAWDTFEELMVLSHGSKPSEVLKNTCTGIRSHTTLKRRVRIRVTESEKRQVGSEEVQLLFDGGDEQGYRKVVSGEDYGVVK